MVHPGLQYFSTLFHKQLDFWIRVIDCKYVSIFSAIFVRNINYKEIEGDIIKMYVGLYVEYH